MEAIICIVGILLFAALLWFLRIMEDGSKAMDEGLDRAFENKERRNRAIEKLGSWLDRH